MAVLIPTSLMKRFHVLRYAFFVLPDSLHHACYGGGFYDCPRTCLRNTTPLCYTGGRAFTARRCAVQLRFLPGTARVCILDYFFPLLNTCLYFSASFLSAAGHACAVPDHLNAYSLLLPVPAGRDGVSFYRADGTLNTVSAFSALLLCYSHSAGGERKTGGRRAGGQRR